MYNVHNRFLLNKLNSSQTIFINNNKIIFELIIKQTLNGKPAHVPHILYTIYTLKIHTPKSETDNPYSDFESNPIAFIRAYHKDLGIKREGCSWV